MNPSPPRDFPSRVLGVVEECAGVRTFRLAVPPDFSFAPGMWVMLRFSEEPKLSRAYSISSSPAASGHIEISFNRVGALTRRLFALKGGEVLDLKGPYGKWRYRDDPHAVLISGGTGLTPFRSMCRYALEKGLPNRLTLLYSAKTPAAILYRRELSDFSRAGIKVHITITRPQAMGPEETWNGPTGRLGIDSVAREVPDFLSACYYLCGPKSLVRDFTNGLLAKGVSRERVRYETWGDY